jgi:hypothetical protein
MDCFL